MYRQRPRVLNFSVRTTKALRSPDQMDVRNFMAYLFLQPFGFYLYIATKCDMPFPFEKGRGTRRWTTSALGLERNRGPRSITLHDRIFARDSAQIHHGRCRNTARRFTAKASCGY